ncbi:MAG: DNA-binding protein [Halomonas sp.]|nr:DNA-binding protein [Halomonas sp.]MCC5882499.1 DNA-binding protein [Halomonas sp.]
MPLTREQAREALDKRGITIAEFCRAHDLNANLVSDLLAGRKKGRRGEAHRAAVLLGIKDGVIDDVEDFPPKPKPEGQG